MKIKFIEEKYYNVDVEINQNLKEIRRVKIGIKMELLQREGVRDWCILNVFCLGWMFGMLWFYCCFLYFF